MAYSGHTVPAIAGPRYRPGISASASRVCRARRQNCWQLRLSRSMIPSRMPSLRPAAILALPKPFCASLTAINSNLERTRPRCIGKAFSEAKSRTFSCARLRVGARLRTCQVLLFHCLHRQHRGEISSNAREILVGNGSFGSCGLAAQTALRLRSLTNDNDCAC
jgi:hypothetical protein